MSVAPPANKSERGASTASYLVPSFTDSLYDPDNLKAASSSAGLLSQRVSRFAYLALPMALAIGFLGRQPMVEVIHRIRSHTNSQLVWSPAFEAIDEWQPVAEVVSLPQIQKLMELWARPYTSEGEFDLRIYE